MLRGEASRVPSARRSAPTSQRSSSASTSGTNPVADLESYAIYRDPPSAPGRAQLATAERPTSGLDGSHTPTKSEVLPAVPYVLSAVDASRVIDPVPLQPVEGLEAVADGPQVLQALVRVLPGP